CVFAFRVWAGEPTATAFNGAIRIDPFSNAITGIILVGTLLTLGATVGYLRRLGIEDGEFHALVLYASGAMILLAQSNTLIMVFVSLETFSMAVYILTAFTRDARRSVEGALKYFVLGGISSGFLLLGLAFIFGASGEIRIDVIGRQLADPDTAGSVDTYLLVAGLGLTLVSFGFKVGAFPFHSWIPDAYEGAPTLVTGFMAVTVKSAAFAILIRFVLVFTTPSAAPPESNIFMTEALWWLAAATMVFGNLVAPNHHGIRRRRRR
ncbi:MAG: NADH-quinone oxidoreductase subunit N, partial [Planctomycetes bacterium]|nr:NADH-quinone oxidoreductase subunit N [Planctomycetota bacterium]